jgi:hypothetical protein
MTEHFFNNTLPSVEDPDFKLLPDMPKPEFMLIGAAKSGTTSFSSYLPIHPQVKNCRVKEPNYWSWKLCNRQQYQSMFVNPIPLISPTSNQQIGGEYSTSYLLNPLVPRRVRACLPDTKIIILLRNPIDRAYSHFIMSQRQGMEPIRTFHEIVEKEIEEISTLLDAHQRGFLDPDYRTSAHRSTPEGIPISVAEHNATWTQHRLLTDKELFRFYGTSYVFRSIYHDQVWRWLQLFPQNQIKIIESERLFNERKEIMSEVIDFLNLQPFEFNSDQLQHTWGGGASNYKKPGSYAPMKEKTKILLGDFFSPYNESLFNLIEEDFNWN